jgi:hypothetical protein
LTCVPERGPFYLTVLKNGIEKMKIVKNNDMKKARS